jgi:hypothetical protein
MGFFHYENIWRVTIGSFGVNELSSKRICLKGKKFEQERGLSQL